MRCSQIRDNDKYLFRRLLKSFAELHNDVWTLREEWICFVCWHIHFVFLECWQGYMTLYHFVDLLDDSVSYSQLYSVFFFGSRESGF